MPKEVIHGVALCAGIAGLELGIKRALGDRYRTVLYVEREVSAAAALVARMEESTLDEAPVWDDLTTLDGQPWRPVVDLVSAGFPCQPCSQAGKQKGKEDDRWIWDGVARLLDEMEPRYVFLENVRGVVRHGLDAVLGTLASLGYDAEWGCFRASHVGAPHRRERWFLLGQKRVPDANSPSVRLIPERREGAAQEGDGGDRIARDVGEAMDDADGIRLADADCERFGIGRQPQHGLESQPGRLTHRRGDDWPQQWPPGPEDFTRWAGMPPEAQPALRGVAHGVQPWMDGNSLSRADRLRALGNGVVPQQTELAFRTLWRRLNE